jgi:hypothetical protein
VKLPVHLRFLQRFWQCWIWLVNRPGDLVQPASMTQLNCGSLDRLRVGQEKSNFVMFKFLNSYLPLPRYGSR